MAGGSRAWCRWELREWGGTWRRTGCRVSGLELGAKSLEQGVRSCYSASSLSAPSSTLVGVSCRRNAKCKMKNAK
jgi:hypothetical protein